MRFARYALMGALVLSSVPVGHSPSDIRQPLRYEHGLETRDERSKLIAQMRNTMASRDGVKEDPRDERHRIVSPRECALLLRDLGFEDDFGLVYDSGAVSIGPEKDGERIAIFNVVGNYTTPRIITLSQAREYLKSKEKK